MPQTKSQSAEKSPPKASTNGNAAASDVLTLDEAAAYLRVLAKDLLEMIATQGLPGRKFGADWRFFKAALQDWLSCPQRPGLLKHLSKIKDDPFLEEMLAEVYAQRGRPEAQDK